MSTAFEYDIFISYASEDRKSFVKPLVTELVKAGLSVWYDEFELRYGDSLRQVIEKGIRKSKYGVVVLSHHFLRKEWPQQELSAFFSRNILSNNKGLIPIWLGLSDQDIIRHTPLLADIYSLNCENKSISEIAKLLCARIQQGKQSKSRPTITKNQVRRDFTQTKNPLEEYYDRESRKYGIRFRESKDVLVKPQFDFISNWYKLQNSIVAGYGKEVLDKNPRKVIVNTFGEVSGPFQSIGDFHQGVARVLVDATSHPQFTISHIGGKWGFVTEMGYEVTSLKYDLAYDFSEGLALVNHGGTYDGFRIIGGEWGFVNPEGQEIIPIIYERANSFSEGLASVRLNGKYGYINKYGKEAIPFQYEMAGNFSFGKATVCINDKWGYIDNTNMMIIKAQYEWAHDFKEGYARVSKKRFLRGEKYGYINLRGELVTRLIYDKAEDFKNGTAIVECSGTRTSISKEEVEKGWLL